MKFKKWIVFLLGLATLPLSAQVFDLNPPVRYSFEPVFMKEYIAKNKIHSIRASLVYKRDNEPIQDKGLSKTWEYTGQGLLTRYYFTTIRGYVNKPVTHPAVRKGRRVIPAYVSDEPAYLYDTTFTDYYYNLQQQLILRRTRDGDYYNAVYYEYDAKGNVRKESVFRETNASDNKNVFRLGVQNQLSTEEFQYEQVSAGQVRCKHLNDEGKVFKQTMYYSDSLGRLTEENNSYTVSWMRSNTRFTYDGNGRLVNKISVSNENGDEVTRNEYKYVQGNLVDVENRYKGEEKQNELNYLYDKQTGILTSHFIREELNKAILIVQYSYEYY